METITEYKLTPSFGNSFGTGWRVMLDNFLRLFLVIIIMAVITGPLKMMNLNLGDFHGLHWSHRLPCEWPNHMDGLFSLASLGLFAAFVTLIALVYSFLVVPVFKYGSNMIFVQAVRKLKPDFELLIKGFRENYLYIVLANLLVIALVVIGFFALIIPGIIIACRLVFVSYIVMDKKLDPIEAVELSWRLTRGHGWTIFFMGFVSIFIILFGLLMLIIGIFPAIIWVSSSFASLYQSVLNEKENPAEPAMA
ncbi:MAG: hypothetical protein LLG13_08520 [Bacteroidales bacterium]|nr:hypothetical protein [Bacteroidales bacterium]